jgi:hypothetical protein
MLMLIILVDMPQIAYHFVNEDTKYLYKKYRETKENNEAFFTAAYNSMKKKEAELRDLTDKKYEFDFGDMHFELRFMYIIIINYY